MDLHAAVGDQIVVDAMKLDSPPRRGEVIEVLGEGEHVHYRVRWDDNGHESVFFPGSTSHVIHPRNRVRE
jgi:hypothetical protein